MSDALSDIARDERRERRREEYINLLFDYLSNPTKEKNKIALKAAVATDAVHGGYWGHQTNYVTNHEKIIKGLKTKDPELISWMKQFTHIHIKSKGTTADKAIDLV